MTLATDIAQYRFRPCYVLSKASQLSAAPRPERTEAGKAWETAAEEN
jgi:hypothetical protein